MTRAQEGGKVVSLMHRPPLPPGNAPGTHFCWRLSPSQGHSAIRILCQWRIPMTLAGIKPATFRFVAQHLNHCATTVPATLGEGGLGNIRIWWYAQWYYFINNNNKLEVMFLWNNYKHTLDHHRLETKSEIKLCNATHNVTFPYNSSFVNF